MKVEGERTFAAPRATVWAILNDPASMAKLMPGVESFDIHDERNWTANVKIPLGLGGLRMSVKMEKQEERELEYARMHAKGTGVGAIMNMQTAFTLMEADGGTAMKWEADVKVAGPVGSMGQRVLQPIVNQQVQNVLGALDRQIQEAAGTGGQAPASQGAGDTGESSGPSTGDLGARQPGTDSPAGTDPEVKDYGPPAESTPDPEPAAGSSGAEEGLNPWSPESYEPEPEGPTTSTEDKG